MEGSMFDPEVLEAAKKFLFSTQLDPQLQSMPSASSERRSRSIDPLDTALGLGRGTQARVEFRGAAELPLRNSNPRLVKRR